MKYIKPPTLSTSFSENGKSAKKRFENILSTKTKKTGVLAFVLMLVLVGVVGALVACNSSSIGIIGSSDGPTSLYISTDTEKQIKDLYNSKIKYVGNNSGVAKIVGLLPFTEGVKLENIELHTDSEPYGVTLNYIIDDYDKAVINNTVKSDGFYKNAILMFCLIENADSIAVNIKDEIKYKGAMYSNTYLRTDFDNVFDKPLREYSTNFENFKMFFISISLKDYNTDIDSAVSSVILSKNANSYLKGECTSEGHIILGTEEKDGHIKAYVLATYGEYGFINGNFETVSGCGIIPTRIIFEVNADGTYNQIEYKQAEDGGRYTQSIKEMFPEKYWHRALSISDADSVECETQKKIYAEIYLKTIGRWAQIGHYADFEHKLPDMNVNVSNSLISKFFEYPYWIGTQEKIENGVRYVYEKQWDDKGNGDGMVTFKKYEYDSKKVIEETVIEVNNGEILYLKSMPRKENY